VIGGVVDWDDFKFLQTVARSGSVRGAGEHLGVHPSTVTRHIEQLEQRLGTRLFARTRRGMEITSAGAAVIEALDRVAAELERVELSLQSRGPELRGTVRVSLPGSVAARLLIPNLGAFLGAHPDIDLVLGEASGPEALQRGEADLALCCTDSPPGELVGRLLGTLSACAYGAGAAAERIPRRWIGDADPATVAGRIRARSFPDCVPGMMVAEEALLVAALRAGLGVGVLPCYVGDDADGLSRLGGVAPARLVELWLFSRPETRGIARVQALSGYLLSLFAGLQDRLSGTVKLRES
jgi:DNA-binding transcriptional LysR family regulator